MEGIQYGIQQGFHPMTAAAYGSQPYGSPFGQQGFAGNPLIGLLGSGIAGLLSAQSIGRQPGQAIDGWGGIVPSYGNLYGGVDPMTAAHIQQLVQQAQLAQQAQVAQQLAQQQLGRASFGVDPMSAAIAQQRGMLGQQAVPWLAMNPMNRIDPVTAAYIQQQQIAQACQQLALQSQLAQQGQFGHPHGQFGQGQFGQGQFGPGQLAQGHLGQAWLGGAQNLWSNPQLGTTLGRGFAYQSPFQYAGGGYGSQLPIY